ncbi:MAG: LamG domain-containing protein [Deltaproteobacteria bacterium]|nr:LamG domain-containing protein [Deltaproteobacteria bacterium]
MTRLTIICISFIIVSLMFAGISDAEINPETCTGMWLFDGNADDSSENNNDGTIMGDPQWVDGKFGKALEFNGVDDYVDLPQLAEQTNQPLSFTAWIKWGGSTATVRGIWGYTNTATVNCHFEVRAAGMRLRLGDINNTGMTNPPVNQWAFVGFTYDGTTARYYLDALEVGSLAGNTGTIFGPEAALGHMVGVSDSGRFFDGLIDDAGLFNIALSEDDIQAIMNQGLGRALGITAVSSAGKLATTWAEIKK